MPHDSVSIFLMFFFFGIMTGGLKTFFPPFEYIIYLTCSKNHVSETTSHSCFISLWRNLTWSEKKDSQGSSQIRVGQEVECLRALNASASKL